MDIKQLRCVSYDGISSHGIEAVREARNRYLRSTWKPDLESLSNEKARTIFPPTTDANVLVEIHESHSKLFTRSNPEHLQRFLDWVQRCIMSSDRYTRHHPLMLERKPH